MSAGRLLLVAAAAALLVTDAARGADGPVDPRLPFSDDVAPPQSLPTPIDRAFKGKLAEYDGERVTLKWDWKTDDQLGDFEPFVPIRATLRGGFVVRDGKLVAEGTAGIRLKLGFLSDCEVHVAPSKLRNPHDLGVVLPTPLSSDDSIICLVQDNLFTSFERDAAHTNMINKLGGITSAKLGHTEFRYVARSVVPRIAPNTEVAFDVVRKDAETSFTITLPGNAATTLKGKDPDAPYGRFTPGLYTSGGAADFGALSIGGKLDMQWCAEHGVLPWVANNLLHPGNKWKPAEKKLAELVERYAKQDAAKETDPKKLVTPEQIAPLVGDVKVPLVVRMRAAEALLERDGADVVAERLAALLDGKDAPARTLAWQLLRPRLPWHFHYGVDADPKVRHDASQAVAAWVRDHQKLEGEGKVFAEGEWMSAVQADVYRSDWPHAWELRTPKIRLRTNLSKSWADWYLLGLEAEYKALVELVGKEPPAASLPLSVLVFKDQKDMTDFCTTNAYRQFAGWTRFVDLDRNVSFSVYEKKDGLANTMGQFAKQYLHFATGRPWPLWYDEGRASWFGNADYGTVNFDGQSLAVGLVGKTSTTVRGLVLAAQQGKAPGVADIVGKDVQTVLKMNAEQRKLWYVAAWALHAWFVDHASDDVRATFADWVTAMERLETTPADVEDVGFREFMARFSKALPEMDRAFAEWVKTL